MRPNTTRMGFNRTGIGTSPIDSKDIIKTAEEGCPAARCDGASLAWLRKTYDNDAEPIGTVPVPSTLKGVFQVAKDLVQGRGVTVFVDKLGERLAFERMGVRLYEALLTKYDSSSSFSGGPTRSELERFRDAELEHFRMLMDTMTELGADPTAITPAADVAAVLGIGPLKIITEPRTSLAQSLVALLTVELADNDGWELLREIARAMDQDELVARFLRAQKEEGVHLANTRRWLSSEALAEAKAQHDSDTA